jgi:hypothetical protein
MEAPERSTYCFAREALRPGDPAMLLRIIQEPRNTHRIHVRMTKLEYP